MYRWLIFAVSVICLGGMPTVSSAQVRSGNMFDVIGESLLGDVYEPSRWHELSLDSLFTEGWDESWASPPAGEGGAPRQGWLNAVDGGFYRLGIGTFNFAENFNHNG